jgi:hypothetical protein
VRFPRSLGIGVGAMMGGRTCPAEKKEKYVVVDSNGGNDPNRAIPALLIAGVKTPETRSPVVGNRVSMNLRAIAPWKRDTLLQSIP